VFPISVSAQFTGRLQASFAFLTTSLELHRTLLQTHTDSPEFSPKAIIAAVNQAEGSLIDIAAAARLLKTDIIYGRFAPSDFGELHKLTRRLVVRSNGMTVYFTLLDPTREKFPVTTTPSRPQTPSATPTTSWPPSLYGDHVEKSESGTPVSLVEDQHEAAVMHRRRHAHAHYKKPHARSHSQYHHSNHESELQTHQSHHNILHHSLLHLAISRNPKPEHAVGVYESNRYINLELLHMTDPDSAQTTAQVTKLLDESADELITGCIEALKGVHSWIGQVREGRWDFWVGKERKKDRLHKKIKKYEEIKRTLEDILERFRYDKRYSSLDFKNTAHANTSILVVADTIF
jgi:hypothetical protein